MGREDKSDWMKWKIKCQWKKKKWKTWYDILRKDVLGRRVDRQVVCNCDKTLSK